MKEATENRLKLLSQHSEVIKRCEKKFKQQGGIGVAGMSAKDAEASIVNTASNVMNDDMENSIATATLSSNSTTPTEDDEPASQLDESNLNNQSLIETKFMKQVKHLNSEKLVKFTIFFFHFFSF